MFTSRLLLVFLFTFFLSNISFAQYEDEEDKRKRKSRKVFAPKPGKSSKARQTKNREDLFRSETHKSTQQSKRQQSKSISKRHKKQDKKYRKTRGELQNKTTQKRMRKSERMSKKINQQRTIPLAKRMGMRFQPNNKRRMATSRKKSNELRKREDRARDKYESSYTPSSKRKKKDKMREFYNPLKRDNRR
jgi:hypothetical protein